MSVVARLKCTSVEHFENSRVIKMTPVTTQDDPHDEEIKQFFQASPSGNVEIGVDHENQLLNLKSGEQAYLYLTEKHTEGALTNPWEVISVRLDGWATYVELSPERVTIGGILHTSSSRMKFTIRNERASEQFQIGSKFYARFEKVDAS